MVAQAEGQVCPSECPPCAKDFAVVVPGNSLPGDQGYALHVGKLRLRWAWVLVQACTLALLTRPYYLC